MMLYIWVLLSLPQDRVICTLWVNQPPTMVQVMDACGTLGLGQYQLDVLSGSEIVCATSAADLADVRDVCQLSAAWDAYRFRVVEPDVQTALCTVRTSTQDEPTSPEIARQCPDVTSYELRYFGTSLQTQPEVVSVCKPPLPPMPASITTSNDYYLLAGKLIWYGFAKSACEGGYSGVDPETFAATPCGMAGARAEMLAWQNGLDAEIISAAREWHVPPELLKSLIAAETQFWAWTGTDGEHGLIQITEDGAAVVLHMYEPGYYQMNDTQQEHARDAWLRQLDCFNCSPRVAYDHAKQVMPLYAQSLAAYYCMYNSWDAALSAWNVKHTLSR